MLITMARPERGSEGRSPEKGGGPFPIYPVLAAVFPPLAVFSANLSIFPLSDLAKPFLLSFVGGSAVYGLASLALRSARGGAAAATALILAFWSWSSVVGFLSNLLTAASSSWLLAGAALVLAYFAGRWSPRAGFLNLVSTSIFAVSAASVAWNSTNPPQPKISASVSGVSELPAGPRPDIFHFVLDGFGSQRSLKEKLDIDLSWFYEGLKDKGFHVAEDARTNYVQTELSLASTLNFAFIPSLLPEISRSEHDRRFLTPLIGESAAMKKLIKSGYRFGMLGTGFPSLRFGKYEVKPPSSERVTLFEGALLEMTPLRSSSKAASSQYLQHYNDLNSAFSWLESSAKPTSLPRFIFAHLLAPHPPFVVDEQGRYVKPKGPYGLWDGSDFLLNFGDEKQYRSGYRNKATFAARRVLKLVDELLKANPSNPPIIVLQGDHGSKLRLSQDSLEKTDLQEAFPILYALYLPEKIRPEMKPVETPVNIYRKVFRALGERDLPDLEDRSWYSTFPRPFALTEVTDKLGGSSP